MSFHATLLTLYPEMFPGHLGHSLAGRALERGDAVVEAVNIRDFATDRHRRSMTRRPAAVPAWCSSPMCWRRRLMRSAPRATCGRGC
jgi:hypothetical protein